MKLETIKKDKRKKIIIGSMIVLSVVGCLTLTTTRAKYRNVQSLKLASGMVKLNSYDFKIVAMKQSEDGENYADIDTMPKSGYVINEEKSYCTTDNKTQVKGKLKTVNGIHGMYGLNKNDKCYIWFDKEPSISDELIASFKSYSGYKGDSTPTFTSVATGGETLANNGIFKVSDGMYGGDSYYWRGAATTNHVIFDNKCWRIVRINGDGSLRLIYNGEVQSNNTCKGNGSNGDSVVLGEIKYNSSYKNSSYVGWSYIVGSQRPSTNNPQTSGERAPLRVQLEDIWYRNNISDIAKAKIVNGKFCNDRSIKDNDQWIEDGNFRQYYALYTRLTEGTKTPTLSCPNGDIYELKVGIITADEVQFAGASGTSTNSSFYLFNGANYWTMSPAFWNANDSVYVFAVYYQGGLSSDSPNSSSRYLRPVINLNSNISFNSGSDGTQNNPYIVEA